MSEENTKNKNSTKNSKKKLEEKPSISTLTLQEVTPEELKAAPKAKRAPRTKAYKGYIQKRKEATTKEEKDLITKRFELQQAEMAANRARKKLAKVVDKVQDIVDLDQAYYEDEDLQRLQEASEKAQADIVEELDDSVAFKPNPGPQTDFLAAPEDEVLYGGARGGGKTYSLIADPLRYVSNGNFKALLFRRTTVELRDIIRETQKLYPKIFPNAVYKKSDRLWEFPSGSTIEFAYAESVDDAERYRGQQYTYIGFDELGQHPGPEIYDLLIQSLRTTDPNLKTYMRATANPGGAGAWWLKERFIDRAPPNTRFWEHSEYIDPRNREVVEVKKSMRYIPATVFDNPYLMQDQSYVAQLAALPESQKEMMLYGNWDVVENGAFPEFNRRTHTCMPFKIPSHWPKFRAIDWGYSSPFCCLWFAVDENENIWVYREYYGKGVLADKFAQEVRRLDDGDRIMYSLIDGSVTAKRGEIGPSIMETLEQNGLICGLADRSPGSRIQGKQEVHKRLSLRYTGALDSEGNPVEAPGVMIFNTCVNLIRTLPLMVPDDNEPEKVKKKDAEDHAYDALRYGLSSRPMSPADLERSASVNRILNYQPVDPIFGA